MKGKSDPMTTYLLRRADKARDPNNMFTMDTMMASHGPMQNAAEGLLMSSVLGGGFTLNRSRAGSGIGGMRRSRNTSHHASHYTTPGWYLVNYLSTLALRSSKCFKIHFSYCYCVFVVVYLFQTFSVISHVSS